MADIVFPGQVPTGVIGADMLPSNYDLVLYRGDAFKLNIIIKDSTGAVIDLTGYTAKASIKQNYADTNPTTITATIPTPTNGTVNLLLPSSASSTIAAGSYIWDFKVIDGGGNARTYLTGDVTMYDEVTK